MKFSVIFLVVGLMISCAPDNQSKDIEQAVSKCLDWRTTDFFRQATVDDVRTCMAIHPATSTHGPVKELPLYIAASATTDPEVITILIESGYRLNPDHVRPNMDTTGYPIWAAARWNPSAAIIDALIENGAILDFEPPESTPLHASAQYNASVEVTKALIEHGSKLNQFETSPSRSAQAPLHLALQHNANLAVTRTLLKAGADVNLADSRNALPVHDAVSYVSDTSLIESIVEQTSDINSVLLDGRNALHFAAKYAANANIVDLLIGAGVKVDTVDQNGRTPLHFAVLYNRNVDTAASLLRAGANVDQADAQGITPLHLAAWYDDDSEIFALLLRSGANPRLLTNDGSSALRRSNNSQIVKILISEGVNPNFRTAYGSSMAHTIATHALFDSSLIDLFREKEVLTNGLNEFGNTALHNAVGDFDEKRVRALLRYGADPNVKNRQGYTTLQLAVQQVSDWEYAEGLLTDEDGELIANIQGILRRHRVIVDLLLDSGADVDVLGRNGESLIFLIKNPSVFE